MNCRDVREVADSFLREELLPETNQKIVHHLSTCASCQTEIDARRILRRSLHDAFDRAPELQSRSEFIDRLRGELRAAAAHEQHSWMFSRRWFVIAASFVFAIGLATTVLVKRSIVLPSDTLAQDAIGDHRNCALNLRLVKTPMPLEEAAQRFDTAFRVLLTAPPDDMSTPGGTARVVERHSCAYSGRRFGHIVLQYQGHVVSLLVTANEGSTGPAEASGAMPHLIGRPLNGLSVVSVNGSRHAVLLVGDLESAELTQLSQTVSLQLARRLAARSTADDDTMASLYVLPAFPPEAAE
jgi:putative zinc finger protein